MYSKVMVESINRLEETRESRMKESIPFLTADSKAEILKRYHPDYKSGTLTELKIGPNKGEIVVHEIADLLGAQSMVNPDTFDLSNPDHEVDVLIIGGGGGGAAAAIVAQEKGASVLLATKLRLGDANTMMAQGGIQAADKPNDPPSTHYLDVVGGGGFDNTPELVRALVHDGPEAISWLEGLGVMFDKGKDGTMTTRHGGGTSRKRMHSARDYTGGEIMKTLRDEVKNLDIEIIEYSPAIELLLDKNGKCTGCILYNLETEDYLVVRAKTVILATGGSGRLHVQGFPTSNHYGGTGDGLVLAYRAGNPVKFMDTMQYHPTGAAFPEQIVGLLVTEKCRSLGAQLVNRNGNRFIYELETRDVESAAIIRECGERKNGIETPNEMHGVWLDTPMIDIVHGEGTVKRFLPAMFRQYMRFNIDMRYEPLLIYPTLHYQNGGTVINDRSETKVKNLYAAGEVTGGVHGRNRLMGNSLLDVIVFGRRAGMYASKRAKDASFGDLTLDHIKKYHEQLETAGVKNVSNSPMLLPNYQENGRIARVLEG